MPTELALALIELIIIHGPTVAIHLMKGIDNIDEVTPDMIRALKVKSPEEFFNEGTT